MLWQLLHTSEHAHEHTRALLHNVAHDWNALFTESLHETERHFESQSLDLIEKSDKLFKQLLLFLC